MQATPAGKATVKKGKGAQGGGTGAGTARLNFSGNWPEPGGGDAQKNGADRGQGGRGAAGADAPPSVTGRATAKAKTDPFDYC